LRQTEGDREPTEGGGTCNMWLHLACAHDSATLHVRTLVLVLVPACTTLVPSARACLCLCMRTHVHVSVWVRVRLRVPACAGVSVRVQGKVGVGIRVTT
jgi:hypothetical protein